MSASGANGDRDERVPCLLSLPSEVFSKIFTFLENKELFNLRKVSKQMKENADYELKSRKSELVVNQKNERKLQGLSEVFRDIRELKFNCTTLPFEQLIGVCNGKLTKLAALSVFASYCTSSNVHLISDVFTNIRDLSLIWITANDESLGLLFSRLNQLRRVQIEAVPVSGSCFESLGKDVESITFDTDYPTVDIHSLFHCDRRALKVLHLVADSITDSGTFVEALSNSAPNLESFGLKLRSNLCNFDQLFLPNLTNLTLSLYGVEGNFEHLQPMKSVEQMCLDIAGLNDVNLARIITNFPAVEWFQLHLSRNTDIKFSSFFVNQMRTLRSLQYIALHDNDYKLSKYEINGFHTNAFTEIIRCLPCINEVDLHVWNLDNDESFEELIEAAKLVVKSRTNLWFEMFINGKEVRVN